MESIRNEILVLLQKNLFLPTEKRQKIRTWCENQKVLESRGKQVLEFLQAVNEKEAVLFNDILKRDPNFFKNIERKFKKENRDIIVKKESGLRQKELSEMESFLEEEFKKLTS